MDGPIDMKQEGYKSLDLTHDLDLGFSRLDFENNYIWGITLDITSVHANIFCRSFVISGGGIHYRGDVRNVGVSAIGFLFSQCGHRRCLTILWYGETTTVVILYKRHICIE